MTDGVHSLESPLAQRSLPGGRSCPISKPFDAARGRLFLFFCTIFFIDVLEVFAYQLFLQTLIALLKLLQSKLVLLPIARS